MAFTQIISLILKYKNVSLFLVGLGILALLYFYIQYLRSTIEDQEQEIITLSLISHSINLRYHLRILLLLVLTKLYKSVT